MTKVLGLQDAKDMIHKASILDPYQMQANWLDQSAISSSLLFIQIYADKYLRRPLSQNFSECRNTLVCSADRLAVIVLDVAVIGQSTRLDDDANEEIMRGRAICIQMCSYTISSGHLEC